MATNESRIALVGSLDLVNELLDDVTMAVVDERGTGTKLLGGRCEVFYAGSVAIGQTPIRK